MLILGIESSCDDTAVALLDCSAKGCFVISEKTASQIDIHKKYGGVVPEIAGRMHAEKIVPLIEEALKTTSPLKSPLGQGGKPTPRTPSDDGAYPPVRGDLRPDVIAVTAGPGLITGLIVGVEAARALSYAWNIPLVAVNHIEGHIHSVEITKSKLQISNKIPKSKKLINQSTNQPINYPALALIASGGHTELILIKKQGQYKLLGKTRDDAAGECFDKVAKLLGLPYPGGPAVSKFAESGNPRAINFPRPMLKEKYLSAKGGPAFGWDFSFAGLKTSALYWLRDNVNTTSGLPLKERETVSPPLRWGATRGGVSLNDFCASFEQAIIDVLVAKTVRTAEQYRPKTVILCGGVSANKKLQNSLRQAMARSSPISDIRYPTSDYCMDNAAMIAVAGYYRALKNDFTDWKKIEADPNWELA